MSDARNDEAPLPLPWIRMPGRRVPLIRVETIGSAGAYLDGCPLVINIVCAFIVDWDRSLRGSDTFLDAPYVGCHCHVNCTGNHVTAE